MNQQEKLSELLLSLLSANTNTSANGNAIGNQSLREKFLADAAAAGLQADETAFETLRESLLAQGVLAKGKGRGGSVPRSNPDLTDFDLAAPEIDPAQAATRKPAAKRTAAPANPIDPQVIAYRHADRRVNNPEVGIRSSTVNPITP